MKKLSKELSKTYFLIFLFLIFTHTFSLYLVKVHMNNHIKQEIKVIKDFINIELIQAKDNGLDYFLKELEEVIDERPNYDEIYLKLFYQGETYSDRGFPNLKKVDYMQSLKILGNSRFYLVYEKVDTENYGELEYFILKDMSEDELFFRELYIYTFGGIILSIIFTFFIARRFMKKLLPQLKELETVNEKINFNTFKIDIDKTIFYKEFSNFLISYETMLERLKIGAEKQTDFINNASHEIKTPLSIIKGYSDLLKNRGRGNSKIFLESVKTIQEETKNMNILVEKLLFLSKQEKLALSLESIFLKELIEDIIIEMEIIYPEQKIIFHSKNVHIKSDWNLLKQVIRNIVDNGIKYGCGNPITIFIQDRGETVVICIKDNGIGISKQNLKNIFDKFYRVDKSRSKEIGGHGLGLSIVKTILESLNGNIEIKSILNEKTEVFLIFKK